MTTHAIHGHEQGRAVADRNRGTILIVVPIALVADIRDVELHTPLLQSAAPARLLDCRAAYNTGSRPAPGMQDR
jgi:Na+/H+ antiporter NhaB